MRGRLPYALIVASLVLGGAVPGWTKPTACPAGRFVVDAAGAQALATLLGVAVPTIEVAATGEVALGGCSAPGKIRAKAKATKVAARWTTCGTGRRVKLKARIASPACDALEGKVSARKAGRARFTAARDAGTGSIPVFCGNGVRDGADQCEGHDGCGAGARCTAACTCEPLPAAPTTSRALIAAALAEGAIDHPTSLVYRAWALFADSRLPPEYDGEAWETEDNGLFREVRRVWNTLPPASQAALQPFLLRPTEVGSYWSPVPTGPIGPAAAGDPPPIDCPFAAGAGERDWRFTETTNFVVWSCGGGDPMQDPYAAQRAITASLMEQVRTVMADAGQPEPDDLVAGPAPTSRIDVYLLKVNTCKSRGGACVPIPVDDDGTPALAAVATTTPCRTAGSGAQVSSSFVLVDVDKVTAASAPWFFRYVMAHEYFHVLENALNLQAQGGGCAANGTPDDTVSSWLVEASAEWAAWAYFGPDGADERDRLFREFQERDPAVVSLQTFGLGPQYEYQAFLYPFFVQQEKSGARAPFLGVWKAGSRARTPAQLDDVLNDVLPFATAFRDFGVRNFNTTKPGSPVSPTYQAVTGGAIPAEVGPLVLEPSVDLNFPGEYARPVLMQALTAQYEHYLVDEHIRWVKMDFQELANSAFVQADVLANVGGTWKRIRVPGLVFEFCRDDPGTDDIQEFYLILNHHDRRKDSKATGSYRTEARFDCPGAWSGSIRSVFTYTEHSEITDPTGTYIHDEREREEQLWTIVATTEGGTPPAPTFDQIELHWIARYEQDVTDQISPASCLGNLSYGQTVYAGSGSGTDRLGATPAGDNSYTLGPIDVPGNQYDISGQFTFVNCDGTGGSFPNESKRNDNLVLQFVVPGLAILQADPMGPKHYTGGGTVLHDEQVIAGGTSVMDMTVSWDLRRR